MRVPLARAVAAAPGGPRARFPRGGRGGGREVPNRRAGEGKGRLAVGERPGPGTLEAAPALRLCRPCTAPEAGAANRAGGCRRARRGCGAGVRCHCGGPRTWWRTRLALEPPAVARPDPAGICRGHVWAVATTTFPSGRAGWKGLMGEGGSCRGRQSASLSAEPGRGLGVAFPLSAPAPGARGRPGLLCRTRFSFPVWCEGSSLHLQTKSVKSLV